MRYPSAIKPLLFLIFLFQVVYGMAQDFPPAMSTHDIGLKDMVSALQLLGTMPDIHLFVVSIESIQQQGIALTPPIQQILPQLKQQVLELTGKLLSLEVV